MIRAERKAGASPFRCFFSPFSYPHSTIYYPSSPTVHHLFCQLSLYTTMNLTYGISVLILLAITAGPAKSLQSLSSRFHNPHHETSMAQRHQPMDGICSLQRSSIATRRMSSTDTETMASSGRTLPEESGHGIYQIKSVEEYK